MTCSRSFHVLQAMASQNYWQITINQFHIDFIKKGGKSYYDLGQLWYIAKLGKWYYKVRQILHLLEDF